MSKSRSIPEELIRLKAYEIKEERQQCEEKGILSEKTWIDDYHDYLDAKKYLEKHRWEVFQWKLTKTLSKRPIRRLADWWETTPIEKFFLEDIKYLLEKSAFLSIITLLAQITIIISLGTWWIGRKERWENEIFSTWKIVKEPTGDKSGVAKLALERLLRNGFYLAGLDLSKTALWGVNLQQAFLFQANFQQAFLFQANFQQVFLQEANLERAILKEVNLQEASLAGANLQQTILSQANLKQAVLVKVKDLTPKQIKSACFWEEAIYEGEWNEEQETYVATEPDNTNFIKDLKKDKSSDPKEPVDCSRWSK